jgi:hypothetical protein
LALGAGVLWLCLGTPALAQPMMAGGGGRGMPDLHAISGRPLPDPGMPAGTLSVRVARKMPANGVADAEITVLVKNAGGDVRKRTAKTDSGGRALIEGIGAGDSVKAEVIVDGEKLATDDIMMPPQGGVRTMLIAGLGPAPAGGSAGAGGGAEDDFSLGASTGAAQPDPSLPTKTLVVRLVDEDGKPIPSFPVVLGAIDLSNKIQVRRARSDADGTARFSDLPTGQGTGYAAVIEWKGTRIGTEPFSMPDSGGARAEIRALARTNDPQAITIGSGGRLILQMQEDSLQFMEILPLENTSAKLFDPGPGALEIPLPKGFVGAQAAESARKVEVRANHGIAVHGAITPKRSIAVTGADASAAGNEVRFGFVLPYIGDSRDFEQPLPNGIGPFAIITEQLPGLTISGRGVGAREERALGGRKYWVAPVEGIPAGGVLKLTISGLPATDPTGRYVAGVLALALCAVAIAFARRPVDEAKRAADSEREQLTARREALFAELVAVERDGRAAGQAQDDGADRGDRGGKAGKARRAALVGQLEGVYQQLAALDEQRAL